MEMKMETEARIFQSMKSVTEPHRRTGYVVRHTGTNRYVGDHNQWVGTAAQAKRFDFATSAEMSAMLLGLDLDTYTVDPVA